MNRFFYIRWYFIIAFLSLVFWNSELKSQSNLSSIQPKPEQIIFSSDIVFQWNPSFLESATTAYRLVIATDSLFSSVFYQSQISNSYSDTVSFTIPAVYYWKMELLEGSLMLAEGRRQKITYSDIFSLTNYSHFYSADSGLVLDNSNKVAKWFNLADTANSLYQNDTASRPIAVSSVNTLNQRSAVSFDGVQDFLAADNSFGLGDLFLVANWGGQATFPSYNGLITGKSSYFLLVADGAGGTKTTFLNSASLFYINQKLTKDFAPLVDYKQINIFRPSALTQPDLQMGKDRANTSRFWNGNVAELIISSTSINATDRGIIQNYLCQKYSNVLDLGMDIIPAYGFCDSTIIVDSTFVSYRWSNGDTTKQITLEAGKDYTLTITNSMGCDFIDNISYQSFIKQPANQVICPGDTFVWDLELPTADYNFVWSDSSTDSLLRITDEGNYYVIVTDTNGCSLSSDTISLQIDSSLFNYSLGPDTSVCRGNSIELLNYDASITSILWSTGNSNPVQMIDTAGTYTIEFSDGNCIQRDTVVISIKGLAPTADFNSQAFCFGDSVMFANNSSAPTGDTIISYLWTFNGTDNSSLTNPNYQFPDTGKFNVLLRVETDKTCIDTITKQVDIQPLPQVDFSSQGNCAKRPIQLSSQTTISKGTIQNYQWKREGSFVSSQTNPILLFDTLGSYNISLIATSDQGCIDSTIKSIYVDPTALLSIDLQSQCFGDSTFFQSVSSLPSDSIARYTWFVNNQLIEEENAKVKFTSIGENQVILRVETNKGCFSIQRDTIEIYNKPMANFLVNDVCEGNAIEVSDNSSAGNDSIVMYSYDLLKDTLIASSALANPIFSALPVSIYSIKQIVTTSNNCIDSTVKTVSVNANPQANFRIVNNNSGAPYTLEVENQSIGANSYQWSSGSGQSSSLAEAQFVYPNPGSFNLELIASSALGCQDTANKSLQVLSNFLDASIENATLIQDADGSSKIRLQLANNGNNKINSLTINTTPEDGFGVSEKIDLDLYKGNTLFYTLNSFLSKSGPQAAYICLTIEKVNGTTDANPGNNQYCITAFPNKLFLKIYPNPVSEILSLDIVLLTPGEVSVKVYDQSGREVLDPIKDQFYDAGYHKQSFRVQSLQSGFYILKFEFEGFSNELKFLKQ